MPRGARFYLDPNLATFSEVSRIVRLLGLPISEEHDADILITKAPRDGKVCFFEGESYSGTERVRSFDSNELARVSHYSYKMQKMASNGLITPADAHHKTDVIHRFATGLFSLALENDIPVSFSWFFPNGAPGVINYRIDIDNNIFSSVTQVLQQIRTHEHWCSVYFSTSYFSENSAPITVAHERGSEVGSHAHHHYTYERDAKSNIKNVSTSLAFLAAIDIPVSGYVTPSAKSYVGIGRFLRDTGLTYTSNFGMLYDSLPFEIEEDDIRYLEVPVHPVCSGTFLKNEGERVSDREVLAYHTQTALALSHAYLPVFLYGHNNDNYRIDYLPEYLRYVAKEFPNHARVTLGAYAAFWHARLKRLSSAEYESDNWAIVTPSAKNVVTVFENGTKRSYPFSLDSFLKSPVQFVPHTEVHPWFVRLMSRYELELIVPKAYVDPTTTRGLSKYLFKSLYETYAWLKHQ